MRARDEQKETNIREKAIEMIVTEGFDGLSMQKLAKAANVSPATIYIYFKNREDLLNQLYIQVQQTFSTMSLRGFRADMSFEAGLWLQWQNRLEFVFKYPSYFTFYEQFRNSPLINHSDVQIAEFKESMKQFVINAIENKQMKPIEPEIFWAIAYGTFYNLVKFHLDGKSMMGKAFVLDDKVLKQAFDLVIQALKPL